MIFGDERKGWYIGQSRRLTSRGDVGWQGWSGVGFPPRPELICHPSVILRAFSDAGLATAISEVKL